MRRSSAPDDSIALEWVDCRTPLGTAGETARALNAGAVALEWHPVISAVESEPVPLALFCPLAEQTPPRAWSVLEAFVKTLPEGPWGTVRAPVIVASSNFGIGSLLEFTRDRDREHLRFATPHASVQRVREAAGWGPDITILSHACVSAQLALHEGARRLHAGEADAVLVFAYDLLSDFVTGGFHALKILNGLTPAPFHELEAGAIGLGDGIAAAVLRRPGGSGWRLAGPQTWNEMYHMTANDPEGSGFEAFLGPLAEVVGGRRVWVKGHGTGTLDAGRLEVAATGRHFPRAQLVSWKGSLGHTLGSCSLVELAVALAAMESGRVPGTVHGPIEGRPMAANVATEPFAADSFDGFVLNSNAFGGAHAGALVYHG